MSWFSENGFEDMVPGGGFSGGLIDPATGRPLSEVQSQVGGSLAPSDIGGDPNQQKLEAYRALATQAGIPIDQSDVNVLNDPRFQSWQPGQPLPATVADYSGGARSLSSLSSSGAPQSIQPFTRQFAAPTMEQVRSRPGFTLRLDEALKALERPASAGGTLNLPGTKLALANKAELFAADEYDKEFGRALTEYDTDFSRYQWNEGNRYNSQRTNRLDDRGIYESDRNFGEQSRLNDFDIWHTQDADQWGRTMSLADLGLRAAGGAGAAGQNYATSASDLITGAGNAAAAGQVASGNAWSNAFGSAANNALSLAALRRRQTPIQTNGEYW